ncbi:AEC family transporter [Oceaniovalibus sp. ACAM 378]|uniref:AEC family transporter n=1 Tax=Oceaniovalibus sp. ACAM 378 TaxID=2599923 RepID=UPI0011D9B78B|nr:AEC family transporter [Oceaniovalibus sp. ACAM 378]TYB88069.1 malonate transporter [Oceaniovalibus sp. ACAM 378]
MLHILTYNILPVFFMLALGFAMGRTGKATTDEARALNRIAFLVLQPALVFPLITRIDLATWNSGAMSIWVGCQIAVFAVTYGLARLVFHRAHVESWLLGMAVIFINTLFYIWQIAALLYGEGPSLPITAIVAWDSAITCAFFIVSLELMAGRGDTRVVVKRIAANPVILSILLGLAVNIAGLAVPAPILTAAQFAGAGAAPLTLFALGVILSSHAVKPTPAIIAFSALKLLAFPVLVLLAFATVSPANPWRDMFLLTAAGPSGAMAFSLAMLYNVRTDIIAPVIIWTSLLSLISLAYLA